MAAVQAPAILSDAAGRIAIANPAARLSFGDLPAGMLMRLKFRMPEFRDALDAAFTHSRGTHCEFRLRVPDERSYRVEFSPLTGEGEERFCLVLFHDVSDAQRIDRMRADFVANASHELRTPLASLIGFIETLRGPARNDAKAQERFLAIMQEQAGRMSRLIDDLLDLSRLEMRPFAQFAESVDLALIVRETADGLAPLAREAGVAVAIHASEGPQLVHGIAAELRQATENLIENACKYGRAGGKVDVTVERESGSGDVLLSVRDYGPGIAATDLPRLTERFYRAEQGHDPALKGTGLGLAIVKHIVGRHRGQLSIQSTLGAGATFTIRLKSP